MEDSSIVIMSRNKETGFLERELGSYKINKFEELIVNIFVEENDMKNTAFMKLSTKHDVDDWEFNAIYDYYDTTIFSGQDVTINEVEDCYNPTWEISFEFLDDIEIMENKIEKLLELHNNELNEVVKAIKDKIDDYENLS